MNTDELINALGADAEASPPASLTREWVVALCAGALGAIVVFSLILHVRGDLGSVVFAPRFLFKFVVTLALAFSAGGLAFRLARPGSGSRGFAALAIAPGLALAGAALELLVTPEAEWGSRAVGRYAAWCVTLAPVLSVAPLAAILYALSRGASTNARLSGFIGGLTAGGIGAAVYALHCTDDSPLFVLVWYSLAIAFVGAAGALIGPKVLRW